jgi:hypothetical protein
VDDPSGETAWMSAPTSVCKESEWLRITLPPNSPPIQLMAVFYGKHPARKTLFSTLYILIIILIARNVSVLLDNVPSNLIAQMNDDGSYRYLLDPPKSFSVVQFTFSKLQINSPNANPIMCYVEVDEVSLFQQGTVSASRGPSGFIIFLAVAGFVSMGAIIYIAVVYILGVFKTRNEYEKYGTRLP